MTIFDGMKPAQWGALLAAALIVGCTSESDATRALAGAGYRDVHITGYRWWGCSKDDQFHTGFEAVGLTGQRVSGVVCSAWMKGSTIRMD